MAYKKNHPLCNDITDGNACTGRVNYLKGGDPTKCRKHGGYPTCNDLSGCLKTINYEAGGIKGRCGIHGGKPNCNDPSGCTNGIQYVNGGIKGRCIKHGGYPNCCIPNCPNKIKKLVEEILQNVELMEVSRYVLI